MAPPTRQSSVLTRRRAPPQDKMDIDPPEPKESTNGLDPNGTCDVSPVSSMTNGLPSTDSQSLSASDSITTTTVRKRVVSGKKGYVVPPAPAPIGGLASGSNLAAFAAQLNSLTEGKNRKNKKRKAGDGMDSDSEEGNNSGLRSGSPSRSGSGSRGGSVPAESGNEPESVIASALRNATVSSLRRTSSRIGSGSGSATPSGPASSPLPNSGKGGGTTSGTKKKTGPGRKGKGKATEIPPQLIWDLPPAEDEALSTFELLEESTYQNYRLGGTRMKGDAMQCECSYSHGIDDPDDACGENCINRQTQVECVRGDCRVGRYCSNQRFQRRQYAPIDIVQTEKKGFGIRAKADIPEETFVYEYVGEVITNAAFQKRIKDYADSGIKHFYFMQLQAGEFIDATKKGGKGRFLNHSCRPNCHVAKWVVGKQYRMGIFTKRSVLAGEELTFDYNVDRYGHDAQECFCGEPNCVGFIGGKKQTDIAGMEDLYIDALGISDDVEKLNLKGNKKTKAKQMDEDYVPEMKPVHLDEAAKVSSAIRQSATDRRILTKLLTRISITATESVQRQLLRLHGLPTLEMVLDEWPEDHEIISLVFMILPQWPLIAKNKLAATNLEPLAQKYANFEDDPSLEPIGEKDQIASDRWKKIKELAQNVLDIWSHLKMEYRIPKQKLPDPVPEAEPEAKEPDSKRQRLWGPTGLHRNESESQESIHPGRLDDDPQQEGSLRRELAMKDAVRRQLEGRRQKELQFNGLLSSQQPHGSLIQSATTYNRNNNSSSSSAVGGGDTKWHEISIPDLPPRWQAERNTNGRPYFYHEKTRETRWVPPTLIQAEEYEIHILAEENENPVMLPEENEPIRVFPAAEENENNNNNNSRTVPSSRGLPYNVELLVAKARAEAEQSKRLKLQQEKADAAARKALKETKARQKRERKRAKMERGGGIPELSPLPQSHPSPRLPTQSSSSKSAPNKDHSKSKEKRVMLLLSKVVVDTMSKYKKDFKDSEQFKRRAKEVTELVMSKEKKQPHYDKEKYDKLPSKTEKKVQEFTKDYTKKLITRKQLLAGEGSSNSTPKDERSGHHRHHSSSKNHRSSNSHSQSTSHPPDQQSQSHSHSHSQSRSRNHHPHHSLPSQSDLPVASTSKSTLPLDNEDDDPAASLVTPRSNPPTPTLGKGDTKPNKERRSSPPPSLPPPGRFSSSNSNNEEDGVLIAEIAGVQDKEEDDYYFDDDDYGADDKRRRNRHPSDRDRDKARDGSILDGGRDGRNDDADNDQKRDDGRGAGGRRRDGGDSSSSSDDDDDMDNDDADINRNGQSSDDEGGELKVGRVSDSEMFPPPPPPPDGIREPRLQRL